MNTHTYITNVSSLNSSIFSDASSIVTIELMSNWFERLFNYYFSLKIAL